MGITKHDQIETRNVPQRTSFLAGNPSWQHCLKVASQWQHHPSPEPSPACSKAMHIQSASRGSYWFYFVPYPETKNLQAPSGSLLRDNLLQFLPLWMGPISSLSPKREGRAIHQPTPSKPLQFQRLLGQSNLPQAVTFLSFEC